MLFFLKQKLEKFFDLFFSKQKVNIFSKFRKLFRKLFATKTIEQLFGKFFSNFFQKFFRKKFQFFLPKKKTQNFRKKTIAREVCCHALCFETKIRKLFATKKIGNFFRKLFRIFSKTLSKKIPI